MIFPTNGKPVCFVMVGLAGAGKSTWAKKTGMLSVSSDAHIERMCRQEGIFYKDGFIRFYADAVKLMNEEVQELVSTSTPFVWDQTNLTKKKRRKILGTLGQKFWTVAVVIDHDVEECVKRRRESNLDHKEVAEQIIRDMASSREKVTTDEGFDSILIVGSGL